MHPPWQPVVCLVLNLTRTPDCEARPRGLAATRRVRMQAAPCVMTACLVADDGGAADAGSADAGSSVPVTSRSQYATTQSISAGTFGTKNTYNSDGTSSAQSCYTPPGGVMMCGKKKKM